MYMPRVRYESFSVRSNVSSAVIMLFPYVVSDRNATIQVSLALPCPDSISYEVQE